MQRQLLGLPVLERFILMSEQFQRGRILRLGNDAYLLIGTGGAQIRLFPFLGQVGEIEVWVAATLGMATELLPTLPSVPKADIMCNRYDIGTAQLLPAM